LTPDVGNDGGGVYQNNTINLNNSFDYTFNVFLGCNGSSGADGIVFILTNNIQGIGAQGGGLGYLGLPGNSLAVEYDTWQNSQDPSYDHIAMESAGSVNHNVAGPVSALVSQSNIDNCAWHTTEIIWNVNTQTYSVYFDGVLRLSYTGNIVNGFFGGNPIVNWGWSGSTGGGHNTQQFCAQSISSWVAGTNYQSCDPTMLFHDISTANVGTVLNWAWNFGDPGSGASNTSNVQNPTHTFTATGSYTVSLIITDVGGCQDTFSHLVTIAPPISLNPTNTNPPCNGGNNGTITLNPTGGFGAAAGYGGFSYSWSNGQSTISDVGLTAGTYNVSVTDGVCSATASYTLNQPPPLSATTSSTAASCGASNGSVSLVLSGGTPPYTGVTWDAVPATFSGGSYNSTGLAAGTYVANFHDANGCSALLSYTATVPSLPCGYTLSTSSTNVSCFGGSNGSVTVTVTGGSGTISISWTNAGGATVDTTPTVSGLPAGVYTYHYSDGVPTTFSGTVVVTQPGGPLTVALNTVNTTCSYLNNGSAVASITANGAPGYTYVWSAAGQPNSPTATNLSPGPISVNVTDNNGCTGTASGTIAGQTAITASVTTTPDSCFADSTGTATVAVSGGTPGYTYQWNNSSTSVGASIYNIPRGNYVVTVTDHNSCTSTATGTVNQPNQLTATMVDSNVACFGGATGTATVTASGGNGGNTYTWTSAVSTTNAATGLAANTYYVTVTDSKLCRVVDSAIITQPPSAVSAVVAQLDSVSCFGGTNGGVTVNGAGGSPGYTYELDASGTFGVSGTFTGLAAGSHTVTVKDAHLCTAQVSFTIYQPTVLVPAIAYTRNISCAGSCDGTIRASASGGTAPYTYSSDGTTFSAVDSFTSLCTGLYTITIKDALGCVQTITDSVTQPDSLKLTVTSITKPLCFGNSNGQIVVSAAGGTPGYLYSIDFGLPQITGTFSGLSAGLHIIGVGDSHLCLDTIHVQLDQPAQLLVDTLATTSISCFGNNNGTITIGVTGGTYPYSYVWPQVPGITDSLGINLSAGSDTVFVTDANGCRDTLATVLSQPNQLAPFVVSLDSVSCSGGSNGGVSVDALGGTLPYTFALDTATTFVSSGVFTGLDSGTHTVTVRDAHLCDSTISFYIYQPTPLVPSIVYTINASCNASCNGSIAVGASGGTPPYTYSKDGINYQSADSFTSLCAGHDTLFVQDSKGCVQSIIDSITEPAVLTLAVTDTLDPKCYAGTDGHIAVSAAGGTPSYSYVFDGAAAQSTDSITTAATGAHSVVVTDIQGCTATVNLVLGQPSQVLTDTLSVINDTCYGSANGAIFLTTTGGFGPYTYAWSGGNTASSATNLTEGTYPATVTDAHGCTTTVSYTITQPAQPSLSILPADTTLTFGDTIQLYGVFGPASLGAPTAYLWADTNSALTCTTCASPRVISTDSISQYSLQLTYNNGLCTVSATTTVTVNQLDTFAVADAFSPNGDRKNDTYYIQSKQVKSFHMDIFDRWGQTVFSSDDITQGWDGNFKGVAQPTGVYTVYFSIVYGKDKSAQRTATITLFR
jgi:gliding motility-associated-like protein